MKKKWFTAIVVVMLSALVSVFAAACSGDSNSPTLPGSQTEQGENPTKGLWYTYDEETDSYLVSVGNAQYEKKIVIPNELDGKPVTTIPKSAFANCEAESFVLPENITAIAEKAFEGCNKLTEIKIPANVTSIGERAFGGCYLQTATFEEPDGWKASRENLHVDVPSTALEDAATAARYLCKTYYAGYCDFSWERA